MNIDSDNDVERVFVSNVHGRISAQKGDDNGEDVDIQNDPRNPSKLSSLTEFNRRRRRRFVSGCSSLHQLLVDWVATHSLPPCLVMPALFS